MAIYSCGFFDGAMIGLDAEPAGATDGSALTAFLRLGPADRLAASRHVHAYYLDFHASVGGEDWQDDEMGIPSSPEAIWDHVHPNGMFIEEDRHSTEQDVYLVVEAECDWEPEHGLMLCFRQGAMLTKCGGYDGHVTNVNAFDDARMDGVVYAAIDPALTTRLDP